MRDVTAEEGFFQGTVSFERAGDGLKPWRLPFEEIDVYASRGTLREKAECPSGVRLRLRTDARSLHLLTAPLGEEAVFDLAVDNALIATARPEPGGEEVAFDALPDGEKTVELWLPTFCPVTVRAVRVDDGASLEPAADERPRWVTYGSSITHGRQAHGPARTWPATAARLRDLHLTNLGFAGECHLDAMVALLIRELPADVITLKLGINVHGGSLSPRTYVPSAIALVRILREKHPDTPLGVVSPIFSPPREAGPGATGLTLTAMRDDLADGVRRLRDTGDANVRYFDGRELFGEELARRHLPDELHPNGDGLQKLGENFTRVVLPKLGF